jgi:hypothetical protein
VARGERAEHSNDVERCPQQVQRGSEQIPAQRATVCFPSAGIAVVAIDETGHTMVTALEIAAPTPNVFCGLLTVTVCRHAYLRGNATASFIIMAEIQKDSARERHFRSFSLFRSDHVA